MAYAGFLGLLQLISLPSFVRDGDFTGGRIGRFLADLL